MRSYWTLLLTGGVVVFGQMNDGEIGGVVRDHSRAVLPGASVTARQAATGREFAVSTNSSGEYLLPQLPVGLYSFTAGAPNFKQAVVSGVEIHASDRLRQDFILEVGERSDIVNVLADSDSVQLESAEIRDVIAHQQVIDLPLRSRQFLDLAMLSPGVVRPPGGTRGDAMQQAGNLVNVLGQRSGHNLYLLDGATITDEHFNNLVIAPSIDSIEEFNIEKTSYVPEFGGKSGALINVVSRSGSNAVHGSLFEFVRNNAFDARNFFDAAMAPIPPFRQNQFGGTVGGPLRQNRAFYFVSYEGQRIRKSLTQTFSVPTAGMRAGDFSGQPLIYDQNRLPFPNNQIPSGRMDGVATALLAIVPLPNLPGIARNLLASGVQRVNTNQYSARIDHRATERDPIYFRASLFDARQADPFGSSVLQESLLPGFGRSLSTHALNGVAGWTHLFTTNILNELRFGFLTVAGGQSSPNSGTPFAAQTGLLGVTSDPRDMGYPQISLGGQFTGIGDPALFTFRDNRDFELYDNGVWHRSTHTFKAGAYFMHFDLRAVNPNGARGVFSFTPRWTSSAPGLSDGNAFADFLLGFPTSAQVGLGRAAMDGSTNWAHLYFQDNWRVTTNLKIDFGVRYEYNPNMTEAGNHLAAIDAFAPGARFVIASDNAGNLAASASAMLPLLPVAYVASSAAGWNNSLLVPRSLRLAPRSGLAWTVPSWGNTVVRAGFGVYPNQAAYSIVTNLAQNLPFFVTKTVNSNAGALAPTFSTRNALTANATGTVGGNNLDHEFKIEYNEVWNFQLEHEFNPGTMLSATYVGSRTVHADSATLLNVPAPGPGPISARRPLPQLSQINDIRWNGWATYHALTLSAKRRYSSGLMFDANWTWSHSIDDASDPGGTLSETNLPQNVYNLAAEKASSSFDHRQRVVVSFLYQLPFAKDAASWKRSLAAGWQAGGNFTAQSGAPFTVNMASDQANIGQGPAQRPGVSGDPNAGPKTPGQWFRTAAFSLPALYSFGDAPRNAVLGPGLWEVDLSLQKDIPLKDATKLQFRVEAFNLLNHPNFNLPNRTAFTANFGTIGSAQDSRQLQLALKLAF